MKLNNNGWGLSTMIICIIVIFAFLLVAAFYTIRMYSILDKQVTTANNSNITGSDVVNAVSNTNKGEISESYYTGEEKILGSSAMKYVTDYDLLKSQEEIKINLETLINLGYITEIKDELTSNACNGYAVITNKSEGLTVKAFLKCDNYKTANYGE